MVVGTPTKRPKELAVFLRDRGVVDAGDPPLHQAALAKLPILIAVGPKPVSAIVAPLVGEPHRDPIFVESPQLLDEAVIEFAPPLARQEGFDCLPARDEFGAISPLAIRSVRPRHIRGIAAVPGVLSQSDLPGSVLRFAIRREGRAFGFHVQSPIW